MSSTRKQYPFDLIESKWQSIWEEQQTFRAWNPEEEIPSDHPFALRHKTNSEALPPKYYILDMFPYPSGTGLHVGHAEGYTATDILARYKRANGYHVLHPMGWDAFGLPAEQYAIKTGQHPRKTTEANIAQFRRQLKALGFSYDWGREINTTDPQYYKWTQWIFLQIYHSWFNPETKKAEPIDTLPIPPEIKTEQERRDYIDRHRLAYVDEAPVNWCPQLGTVLANEEVINGRSEVGNYPVIRQPMKQWMLRITAYADRLLEGLETIDWSSSLKEMQRNWIGRSEGAEVNFRIPNISEPLNVFTTRPDTLFGATYMVLAPEHPLIDSITPQEWPDNTPDQWKGTDPNATSTPKAAVEHYRNEVTQKSEIERTELTAVKTGVFTGAHAINPVNGEALPIWIADYVLLSYGTGAIMAVPAHDTRDLEFARKFDLPVRIVVQAPEGNESLGYVEEDGTNINSDFLNGLPTPEAKQKINDWLEQRGHGRRAVNYKLRDWLFSRQRYWGEPFPIVWKDGYHYALSESDLPVVPPELDEYKPTPDGAPPLARAGDDWLTLSDGSVRETNTMPQWAGSCWYYLRFLDPNNSRRFCSLEADRYWMQSHLPGEAGSHSRGERRGESVPGVDVYVGGAEHAVLHLLYARFWHKILYDLDHVSTPEPFYRLVNPGIVLGEDSQKMSKSRGNVVNPDDILKEYGADAFRLYEMFMGPLEMMKPWSTQAVEGVYRFLGRIWRLFIAEKSVTEFENRLATAVEPSSHLLQALSLRSDIVPEAPDSEQAKTLHSCIKKVTEDIEALRFNTAISAMMVFVNEATNWEKKPFEALQSFLILLHPFAPHLAEELFQKMQAFAVQEPTLNPEKAPSLAYVPWPQYDPNRLVQETFELPVQVNGKVRDRIQVSAEASKDEMEEAARASQRVQSFLEGKTVKKVIVVPKKLVNIVVG